MLDHVPFIVAVLTKYFLFQAQKSITVQTWRNLLLIEACGPSWTTGAPCTTHKQGKRLCAREPANNPS